MAEEHPNVMAEEPPSNTVEDTSGYKPTDARVKISEDTQNTSGSNSREIDEQSNPAVGAAGNCEGGDVEEQTEDVEVDPAVIEKLTNSVLEMFLPNLQKAKGSLNELLHNQEVLIETVQQENSKFSDSAAMKQLIQTMHDAKMYHSKLVNLKKEMNFLMDKSTKLKHRAVKLQQQKQKEELTRAAQQEKELERERMLTAKVAKKPAVESMPK